MEWAITGAILLLFVLVGGGTKKPAAKPRPEPQPDPNKPDPDKPDPEPDPDAPKDKPGYLPVKPRETPTDPRLDPVPEKDDPIVGPLPESKKPGPSPDKPSPLPTPGEWYQVGTGDLGDILAGVAYGPHVTHKEGWKSRAWKLVTKDPENAWIAYDAAKGWTGGLVHKYSGYKTPFGSGTRFPLVYFPILSDAQVNP